jgi:hypothetical protein
MKTPSKPGSDFAKQYGAVERGNRNAQPPGKSEPGMTTSPKPKPNPKLKSGAEMKSSPRPKANPRSQTAPKKPSKPRYV